MICQLFCGASGEFGLRKSRKGQARFATAPRFHLTLNLFANQSFSRVKMSPVSSPHSWARSTRRMILPERVSKQAISP
jgi:hypothetical protein